MADYEIIPMGEDTWRIEDCGVRFFLLTGRDKALMIDSGRTTEQAKEICRQLTDLPIELINTHADGDHVSGNGSFDWFYLHPSECANYYRGTRKGCFRPVYEGDVLDGKYRPENATVFGSDVAKYNVGCAVFLCDR